MADPETPSTGTMSALDAALVNDHGGLEANTLAEYRQAKAAEAKGQPLPPVARPGVLTEDEYQKLRARQDAGDFLTDAERSSLRRTARARQQEKVKEGARRAAERVVADHETALKAKDEEIAALRRDLATAQTPRVPAQVEAASVRRPVAVPDTTRPVTTESAPDPNDVEKYPAGEYDPKYIRDLTKYELKQEQAVAAETERRVQAEQRQRVAWGQAVEAFTTTIEAARKDDPELQAALQGELASKYLVPVEEFHALQAANVIPKDAQPQPINFLASYLIGVSKIPAQLLKHFHTHPDELRRVLAAPTPMELYHVEATLRAHASASASPKPAASAPSPAKVITDATPPVSTLGRRGAPPPDVTDAAITASGAGISDGVRDFLAARRSEMAGARRG